MKAFIDSDFKCHVSDNGTMTPVETDFFDDKWIARSASTQTATVFAHGRIITVTGHAMRLLLTNNSERNQRSDYSDAGAVEQKERGTS